MENDVKFNYCEYSTSTLVRESSIYPRIIKIHQMLFLTDSSQYLKIKIKIISQNPSLNGLKNYPKFIF